MARLSSVTRMLAGVLLGCAAMAQLPRVGDINFYGLRQVTAAQILTAAEVAQGGTLPAPRTELEDRILQIPAVTAAHVQAVCCDGDRVSLFIGIEERGEPSASFHARLVGPATLPPTLMASYRQYEGAVLRAQGAAVLQPLESRFAAFARTRPTLIRQVLRTAADSEARQAAATVARFAVDKKAMVDDLLFAALDPDADVRARAAQSLTAIATVARKRPELRIHVSANWCLDLLDSVVLSDRVEAVKALLVLTGEKDAVLLDKVRERSLRSLSEMARWKTTSYARPPFLLLGRVAGMPDAEVQQNFDKGDREPVIQKALDSSGK